MCNGIYLFNEKWKSNVKFNIWINIINTIVVNFLQFSAKISSCEKCFPDSPLSFIYVPDNTNTNLLKKYRYHIYTSLIHLSNNINLIHKSQTNMHIFVAFFNSRRNNINAFFPVHNSGWRKNNTTINLFQPYAGKYIFIRYCKKSIENNTIFNI